MNTGHTNLIGKQAIDKIRELVEHARTAIMLTALDERPIAARPMAIQKIDDQGQLYFFSHRDSEKNIQIEIDHEMQIIVNNESKSEYLSLHGYAEVFRDQAIIDELYSIFANTWFEGKDDPNLTIIRFRPENGFYWDTRHGAIVQLAGIFIGAITGRQTDDGISGKLKP